MDNQIICEQIAHLAGFAVSVGNWISPNGTVISGENYETHHRETLEKFLNCKSPDNHLIWMQEQVEVGFIRLVFRTEVLFQIGASSIDEIWEDAPNFKRMMSILSKIKGTEIHIFSKQFYIIGKAEDIVSNERKLLQIREMRC
jgi:hypothetical protein